MFLELNVVLWDESVATILFSLVPVLVLLCVEYLRGRGECEGVRGRVGVCEDGESVRVRGGACENRTVKKVRVV